MGKWKVASAGLALSTAAIMVLVQCAPKKSDSRNPEVNKTSKANATLTEGVDFSGLEKDPTKSPDAAALLKSLKAGSTPNNEIIIRALIELHMKLWKFADGKESAQDAKDKALAKIKKYVENAKINSAVDLKKVYQQIETEKKRKMRYDSSAITLIHGLEKGDVQEYSSVNLLALAWLNTSNLDRTKALVVIEEGSLRLAELRNTKEIHTIDGLNKNLELKAAGTTEEVVKASNKRVVLMEYFLIHEIFKGFVADQKAWALKVQRASHTVLTLKFEEKALTANSEFAKEQLNQSALLIGKPVEGAANDLPGDFQTPGGTAGAISGTAGTISGTAGTISGTAGAVSGTAESISGAVLPNKPTPSKDLVMQQQLKCPTIPDFKKSIAEAVAKKDKSLLGVFGALFGDVNSAGEMVGFLENENASLVVLARLENVDAKAIQGQDTDLDKLLADGLNETKTKDNTKMVLLVTGSPERPYAMLLAFSKNENQYLKQFRGSLNLKEAAMKSLINKAKLAGDSAEQMLYLEAKTKDKCM